MDGNPCDDDWTWRDLSPGHKKAACKAVRSVHSVGETACANVDGRTGDPNDVLLLSKQLLTRAGFYLERDVDGVTIRWCSLLGQWAKRDGTRLQQDLAQSRVEERHTAPACAAPPGHEMKYISSLNC